MSWTTLGDAARFHVLQQDGTRLRQELQRLTSEMSSGRQADLGRATGGDFVALADISRSLRLSQAFSHSIAEASFAATARQTALERIEAEIDGLGPQILGISAGGNLQDLALALTDGPERLEQAVSALNTRVADVSLFSGNAPDRPALISGAAMLAELRPLVAGAASPADMIATLEAWFLAPGGGFETLAWQGGTGPAAPAILGEGAQTQAAITALDPALREVLAGLALTALASEATGSAAGESRHALVGAAAARLQGGEDALIRLRSDLGAAQARIEEARVTAEAARAGLEIEQARLTEADPYRTATDLQAAQTRLETLYVLTARLSRLTLTEFLR
jgi:flagellar hook-associated protein 3 FlgL